MLRDIEDTPTYKRLVQQGREQGLEEGMILATRQNIEAIVKKRFPASLNMVKYQNLQITALPQLQEILLKASTARTTKEFKQYLLNLMERLDGTNEEEADE